MLMRKPGHMLAMLATIIAAWSAHQADAFRADAAAFHAALRHRLASAEAQENFNRLGAAVSPLIYHPDEEPLVPAPDLPEHAGGTPRHTGAVPLRPFPPALPLAATAPPDTAAEVAPLPPAPPPVPSPATFPAAFPISSPVSSPTSSIAEMAYAALEAGALAEAAALFRTALDAQPSGQLAADLAYTRLRLAQRREAVTAFEAALALGPPTPEAGLLWQEEINRLTNRFSFHSYAFFRLNELQGETTPFSIAAPGQSQSAIVARYVPDPLASQPPVFIGRLLTAYRGDGTSPLLDTAQATLGLGWIFAPPVQGTLVAERWVRVGRLARNSWALRAYGGYGEGYGPAGDGSIRWLHWSAFGEAAIVGLRRRDLFAGGELRAGYGRLIGPNARATFTAALWGLAQHDGRPSHRLEAGPSLGLEADLGQTALHLRLDYRIAVSAEPASGNSLALTLAAGF